VSVTPGRDAGAGAAIVRAGFRRDPAHRRAALIAFLLTFIIALVSIWPAWRWWAAALEYAPRGDSLIDRVDLVVLKELVQFDRSSAFGMTGAALSAGAVLALLLNPLLAGGVLGLLVAETPGADARRFFDAGVGVYWRFARALLYVGGVGALVTGLVAGLATLAIDAVSERGLERLVVALWALRVLVLVAVAAFVTAVLDLARARLMLTDSRRVASVSIDALQCALRRMGALARIGLAYAGLLLPVAALIVWLRARLPGGGWGWLVVAFLLQQLLAYGRLRLRVATLASELALARAHWTEPPPAPPLPPPTAPSSAAFDADDLPDDPSDDAPPSPEREPEPLHVAPESGTPACGAAAR
jgi:hypothetical protein